MDVRKALLAPVAVLLLASCSGSGSAAPGPATLPPLEPPTSSPTPTLAALPPLALEESADGAAAFARYYVEELAAAGQSGDLTQLRRISDPGCDTCTNVIKAIEKNAEAGTLLDGGDIRVLSAEASMTTPGDALVDVFYRRDAAVRVGRDGEVRESAGPVAREFLQLRALFAQDDDRWIARGIRFPEVPQ